MNQREIVESVYKESLEQYAQGVLESPLNEAIKQHIKMVAQKAENAKGVVAVLITLFVQKIFNPKQDIRYHQAQLPNGFSGRSIDTEHITPFIKLVKFPAMAESGWMTHSLAEAYPYDLDYQGKIRPKELRSAFLELIDYVENNPQSAREVLIFLFKQLIMIREQVTSIELAKPQNFSIAKILEVLQKHFTQKYTSHGASRLPVLAVYGAYQCMMGEVARFSDKKLCALAHHSAADLQSGSIGDIDVNYSDSTAFEGVEIKHGRIITPQLVLDAYEKFKAYKTQRYYLLTTADMQNADWEQIQKNIAHIAQIHGCEVIVNGVYGTLQYYLRLLKNTADFIDRYVELLKSDDSIKYEHKKAWNDIVASI